MGMDGEISPERLAELRNTEDNPLVVDIRNPGAFEHLRIPGSINLPLSQLPQNVDQLSDADHVVTVCPHGKASVRAARLITAFEGFDGRVESLESGLAGWEGPVEEPETVPGDPRSGHSKADTDDSPDAPF